MEFTKLKVSDYPAFLSLYNQTFDADQRRDYRDEHHLDSFIKEKGGKFHAFAAKDGDLFFGFLSYWTFQGYIYIEHFAVNPSQRGKRIGTLMLNHLIKEVGPDILIEVEHPDTEDNIRRIKFYERNGFRRRDEIEYMQPPYTPGKSPVKLLLMTHGDVRLNGKDDLKEMLQEVYNVNSMK